MIPCDKAAGHRSHWNNRRSKNAAGHTRFQLDLLGVRFQSYVYDSLHHSQVFERMTAMLLGFISRPEDLDFSLLGFNFFLVLLKFLLSSDVWVGHRLRGGEQTLKHDVRVKPCTSWVWRSPYLHGSVSLASRSPLWELLLDGGEGQGESLQPHLLLHQLNQLLRQVL